jgi:hypothetical protein
LVALPVNAATMNILLLLAATVVAVSGSDESEDLIYPPIFVDHPPSELLQVPRKTPPPDGSCVSSNFKACQYKFATALQTTQAIMGNATLFRSVVSAYYRKPLQQGLLYLCNQRRIFHGCLGSQYEACVDPWLIMRRGSDIDNAFDLASIYRYMEFDCDGGFIQAIDHWPCIKNVWATTAYGTAVTACTKAYKDEVAQNPTQYCTWGQALSLCLANVFIKQGPTACGTHQPVADLFWWECERTRVRFQLDGFCPTMHCDINGTTIASSQNHINYESRVEALRQSILIPDEEVEHYKKMQEVLKRRRAAQADKEADN